MEKLFDDPSAVLEEINEGKSFYTKRAETLIKYKPELKRVLGDELPKDKSEIANYLREQISKLTDKDKELKEIYEEIASFKDCDSQLSRCKRTIERINKIEKACGGTYSKNAYSQYMQSIEDELLSRMRKFAQIARDLKENPQSIRQGISEAAQNCLYDGKDLKLNKIYNGISTFGQDLGSQKNKLAKEVVEIYKDMTKSRYRFIKEVAGISLGLFVTVPITCHALNWVYPRFMDIFMPNLARPNKGASDKTGGNK